jgi:hypothetical protein
MSDPSPNIHHEGTGPPSFTPALGRHHLDNVTAEAIRDGDEYSGVRVRLPTRLASAREPFHVDVSVGDPIWPEPAQVSLPRLLGQEPIQLRGYPMEMVLRQPGHHRHRHRPGDLGSHPARMEPHRLAA